MQRSTRRQAQPPITDLEDSEGSSEDSYVDVAESDGTADSDRDEYDSAYDSPGSLRDFVVNGSDGEESSEYMPSMESGSEWDSDSDGTDSTIDSLDGVTENDPHVILALPGQGKGSLLSMLQTRTCAVDADSILMDVKDDATQKPLGLVAAHYHETVGLGAALWYRHCFAAILKARVDACLGPILCTFLGRPGETKAELTEALCSIVDSAGTLRPEHVSILVPSGATMPCPIVASMQSLAARHTEGGVRVFSSLRDLLASFGGTAA